MAYLEKLYTHFKFKFKHHLLVMLSLILLLQSLSPSFVILEQTVHPFNDTYIDVCVFLHV